MAQIENVKLGNLTVEHANISNPVGEGQINERNDVMLIQALFKLVGWSEFFAGKYFGLALNELPEPTGNFDLKTIKAIRAFQRKISYKLLNIDGKIHPASYQNRVLKNAFNTNARMMIITLLNMYAIDAALMIHNSDNPIQAVKKIAPSIVFK